MTDQITIHSASIHHSNASLATLKMSSGDGSASNPIEYSSSLLDQPANPSFQPNRHFSKPIQANLISTDVVTECVFSETGTTPKVGGFGVDNLHCFGLLTYSPPYPLSICQSIPTEFTLQAAFGFKLKTFNDVQDDDSSTDFKRKRRSLDASRMRTKRQSNNLVHDFLDRDTFVGEVPDIQDSTVQRDLEALFGQSSSRQLSNVNLGVSGGEQFPICVGKSGGMLQLKPIKIKSGGQADPKQVSDCSSIKTTPRPSDEVLNNKPVTESAVTNTQTTKTTTITKTTTSTPTQKSTTKKPSANSATITTKSPTRLPIGETSADGYNASEPNANVEPEAETNSNPDTRNNEPVVEPETENVGVIIVPSFVQVCIAMIAMHSLMLKP